jgi:UDP-N-acetylglucosamine diphosphorylase/glucosamine-1-phosphate N-acetyltransferase
MRICLFEDHGAVDLEPLTLTRPAFDLLCGLTPLSAKQARYFAPCTVGTLVRPFLSELQRQRRDDIPVNDGDWLRQGPVVLVNGRWLPPDGPRPEWMQSCVGNAFVSPRQLGDLGPATIDECLDEWKQTLPRLEASGAMIARPWDLVDRNANEIVRDFAARGEKGANKRPMDFSLVGPAGRLAIDPSARIDPLVVADTTNGPVVIDRDAVIAAFTRLEGPCYVGPGTHVLGAKIRAGTTLGPCCRVGGEVEASLIHGFSNKYHDGFLGHSYVGEWVNIGAGAQTSDLRHDYGEVILTQGGLRVASGSSKVGSFIGDHTKIGIGSLLNTGTNLGAFTGVLPAGRLLPRYVPSFCTVSHGVVAENEDPEMLFATAQEVMRRRGVALGEAHLEVYRAVFEQTAPHRQDALRESDRPRMRRSA